MKHNPIRAVAFSSLLAVFHSLSAGAALYYSATDSGAIPQAGGVFSVEGAISDIPSTITSVELILRFNDSSSLSGSASGITGHLILGTSADSPYVEFFPVATFISGQERIYDATFSGPLGNPGTGFNNLDPNTTCGLVLWDNSNSVLQNGLNGWSLNIEAVPEPVNKAMGVFAALFMVVGGRRWLQEWKRGNRPLRSGFIRVARAHHPNSAGHRL
jgi:hypothetical protein